MEDYAAGGAGTTPLNDLLTVREAAEATGHTVYTLNQYRSDRRSGADAGPEWVKRGRAVFYTRAALDAYVARRRGV